MHPKIYACFEEILGRFSITGSVWEVGAVPTRESLLLSPLLASATKRVGINLDGGRSMRAFAPQLDRLGFEMVCRDANHMSCFADGEFQVVLSSSTAEHDRSFWLTLQEMRRVLAAGGLMIVSVPGFVRGIRFPRMPLVTYTHRVHEWPGDFYRFSEQACSEVFFADFERREQKVIMTGRVPYIITAGIKPA
jgi:SAM-dependent methyltransferase